MKERISFPTWRKPMRVPVHNDWWQSLSGDAWAPCQACATMAILLLLLSHDGIIQQKPSTAEPAPVWISWHQVLLLALTLAWNRLWELEQMTDRQRMTFPNCIYIKIKWYSFSSTASLCFHLLNFYLMVKSTRTLSQSRIAVIDL